MTVVDATERLMAEFEDRLNLKDITDVVRSCQRDLAGTPTDALPELVERLARQRLVELTSGEAPEPQPDRVIQLPGAVPRPDAAAGVPGRRNTPRSGPPA